MCEKARFVLGAMEQRMAALGFGWADVTAAQVYTIFDIHLLMADEFVRRGTISGGLTWHFARPPVQGLEDNVMALFGAIRAWNCSASNLTRTGRISAMWNRIPIERCPGQVGVCYPLGRS